MESLVKPRSGSRRKVHQDQSPREAKPKDNNADADTYLVYLGKIEQEEARVAAARKRLNKIWKLAINAGIVRKDMELVRRFADQDADTVLQTLVRIKTYATFQGLPAGSQISLLEIPTSSILSSNEQSDRAYRAGYVLGVTGKNPDDQAYPVDNEYHQRHMAGWADGQKVLLDRIQPIDIAMESDTKGKAEAEEEEEEEADAAEETEAA